MFLLFSKRNWSETVQNGIRWLEVCNKLTTEGPASWQASLLAGWVELASQPDGLPVVSLLHTSNHRIQFLDCLGPISL